MNLNEADKSYGKAIQTYAKSMRSGFIKDSFAVGSKGISL